MTTALICIALLGLLIFVLGFGVSMARMGSKRAIGIPEDPGAWLHKIARAHGNAAEYAPMMAILMLVLAMREPAAWMLWLMAIATAARYAHAAGMLLSPTLARAHPLRFAGSAANYACGAGLALAVLATL